MLADGKSEEEIKQHFVDYYGARVLSEPPRTGFNWLVYVVPPIVIVAGTKGKGSTCAMIAQIAQAAGPQSLVEQRVGRGISLRLEPTQIRGMHHAGRGPDATGPAASGRRAARVVCRGDQ